MSAQDWVHTLDDFEERLESQWSALHEGTIGTVEPFSPPDVTTALPREFVERATALVWRCRALEAALASALEKVGEQLERAADAPSGPPAQPVYFDSRV